jgi:rubredoxin
MAENEEEIVLDLEKQSIRGRACPVCGGKIIPSDRAVYQSTATPDDLFPLWECERCGYTHMSQKPKPAPKHAPPKPAAKPPAAKIEKESSASE